MKRYRTIIELVTEAEDRHEATDLAGEYLRGNISDGVSMRCSTYPVNRFCGIVGSLLAQMCSISAFLMTREYK